MTKDEFKSVRLRMGISKPDLANALGVTIRCIYYYESGTRAISPTIEKLLTLLQNNQQEKKS